jgi:fused signal recognition particle receptor
MTDNKSDSSIEWASQAYALLKQKQELKKQEVQQKVEQQKVEQQKLEQQKLEQLTAEVNKSDFSNLQKDTEVKLGEFDDNFTWSAMVLAAQGKKVNEISIDEIDWLSKLRRGLEETRKGFVSELLDKLGDDPLTPESLDDLETLLIRADVGIDSTDKVINSLRKKLNEEVVGGEEGIKFLKDELRAIIEKPIKNSGTNILVPQKGKLNVWLIVGVNGVGKTTTLGKLAYLSSKSNYKTLIAAADTFRAAAVEQLQVWGDRSNVDVISNQSKNADPAAVVFDAINAANKRKSDLLLVDTAGRLQNKNNLMDELSKIKKIIDKKVPDASIESLLVLDASQGQNGLKQAKSFAKSANLSGAIITKLDGTSRGGVSLAVSAEVNLPIRFIGAGEGIKDLRPFNSFEFIEALLADR